MTVETPQRENQLRERGVRAKESYVRISASKVRPVLNQIRGKSYERAVEILALSERKAGAHVLRCLESAAKNAEHNNNLPVDELFVSECFADEGLTIPRWRARARGRATRIRKRTSTITIFVNRYSPEDLETIRERGESRQAADTEARSRRVQASRKQDVAEEAEEEAETEEAADEEAEEEAKTAEEDQAADADEEADEKAEEAETETEEAEAKTKEEPKAEKEDEPEKENNKKEEEA